MTNSARTGTSKDDFPANAGSSDDFPANAGSSTEQHITGAAETGTFITDEAPTADTPVHGSSNAGVNATGANRRDSTGETTSASSSSGD